MSFRSSLQVCVMLLIFSGAGPVRSSDGLLDFSLVNPPVLQNRVIKEPVLTWSVEPDAAGVDRHCQSLKGFDGGGIWREGCVAWSVENSRCTLVTTQSTSHSLMGRLLLMCLMASDQVL